MVSYSSNLFQFLLQCLKFYISRLHLAPHYLHLALRHSTRLLFSAWLRKFSLSSALFHFFAEPSPWLRFASQAKQLGSRDESLCFVFQWEPSHFAPLLCDLALGFWLWHKNWGNSWKLLGCASLSKFVGRVQLTCILGHLINLRQCCDGCFLCMQFWLDCEDCCMQF